jgi:kinesin family member 12
MGMARFCVIWRRAGGCGATLRMGEAVRVVARIRPLLHPEISRGDEETTTARDSNVCVKNGSVGQQFSFNETFSQATQDEVFHGSGVANLLDRVLQGFACSIFAYGQTGV